MVRIRHTTVYRTDCSTLRLFVKTRALRALVGDNEIYFLTDGCELFIHIYPSTICQFKRPLHPSSIRNSPLHTRFINRIVWTFRLASPAVNTLFCDNDCHNIYYKVKGLLYLRINFLTHNHGNSHFFGHTRQPKEP